MEAAHRPLFPPVFTPRLATLPRWLRLLNHPVRFLEKGFNPYDFQPPQAGESRRIEFVGEFSRAPRIFRGEGEFSDARSGFSAFRFYNGIISERGRATCSLCCYYGDIIEILVLEILASALKIPEKFLGGFFSRTSRHRKYHIVDIFFGSKRLIHPRSIVMYYNENVQLNNKFEAKTKRLREMCL